MAFIAGAIIGAFIGAALMYAYNYKEIRDISNRMDALDKSFNNTINTYIRTVYMCLVKLRDSGTDGLDSIIGSLGRVLDDHPEEESECNSDQ